MDSQSFANVWDALTETPAESAEMTARSNVLLAVQRVVASWRAAPEASAERLGIDTARLNALETGKIGLFSLDQLVGLAARAGLTVEVRAFEAA